MSYHVTIDAGESSHATLELAREHIRRARGWRDCVLRMGGDGLWLAYAHDYDVDNPYAPSIVLHGRAGLEATAGSSLGPVAR